MNENRNAKDMNFDRKVCDKCLRYNTDPSEIAQARLDGMTLNKMSQHFKIPRTSLSQLLREMGLGDIKSKWGTKQSIDIDWLREEYVEKGRSIQNIASELGIEKNIIWRLNKEHGFDKMRKQHASEEKRAKQESEESALAALIEESQPILEDLIGKQGLTHEDVAEKLGVSPKIVRKACSRLSIKKRRTVKRTGAAARFEENIEAHRQQLEGGEVTLQSLCDEYGISYDIARKICSEHGVARKAHREPNILERAGKSEQWLRDQIEKGNSMRKVAEMIGCSDGAVAKLCKQLGIKSAHATSTLDKIGVDTTWLLNAHIREGKSYRKIAETLGVSSAVVEEECRKRNVQSSIRYACHIANVTEGDIFDLIDVQGLDASEVSAKLGVDEDIIEDIMLNYDEHGLIGKYDYRKWGISAEWLYHERFEKPRGAKALARELSIPYGIMDKIINASDLYNRGFSTAEKYNGLDDDWFRQKRAEGASMREIARELEGVMTRPTIRKIYKEIDEEDSWRNKRPFKENRFNLFVEKCDECRRIEDAIPEHPAQVSRAEKYGVTREWVHDQLIEQKRKAEDVASEIGISVSTLWQLAFELGIRRPEHTTCERLGIDPQWLREQRIEQGASLKAIAKLVGCSAETIKNACIQEGIDSFDTEGFCKKHHVTYDQIENMRCKRNMTTEAISKSIGCHVSALSRFFWATGMPRPISKTVSERYDVSREDVEQAVSADNASLASVAKALGVTTTNAEKIIIEHDLPVPHRSTHSTKEDSWKAFLEFHGIPYLEHQRCLVGDDGGTQEIDILCKDVRVGIEVSPTYTHNHDKAPHWGSGTKSVGYHQTKAMFANKIGINLIQAFDWHEAEMLQDLVLRLCGKLRNIDVTSTSVRNAGETDMAQVRKFFEGNSPSSAGNELHSDAIIIMETDDRIIGALAASIRNASSRTWIIDDICFERGITVTGGLIKLIESLVSECSPSELICEVDYNLYNGSAFEDAGFEHVGTTNPNCVWVKEAKRGRGEHKFEFSTDKNSDEMLSAGYVRMFDSGRKRYRLSL